MISSFLGPCKGNKVVIEDSNFHIVRCPYHLLKETVTQDPFNFVVEDTLESHHQNYSCSTTSLLAMWYFWKAEFSLLLREGYQLPDIVTHSQSILETVLSHLHQIELDLKTLIFPSTDKSLKMSYSRHYSATKIEEEEVTHDNLKNCIHSVVEKLSHDDKENSRLVSDLWMQQQSSTHEIKFCSENMILCPLTLPSSYSSIVEGCIIKSKLHSWCDKELEKNYLLIIKGSLTHDYVDIGGSSHVNVTLRKKPAEVTITKRNAWLQKCFILLKKLQINVLLVHGTVDDDIVCYCLAHSICLFSHIPWAVLEILCLTMKTSPCTYLLDCNEKNILSSLELRLWKPTQDFTSADDKFLLVRVASESVKLYTVVLCHPNLSYLRCLEHQFMHLVSRLSLVVKSNKLLPGSGKTEEWCCNLVRRFSVGNGINAKIGMAIANGFIRYYDFVYRKLELKDDFTGGAYDDVVSKVEAWKSALCIVIMELQCDTILINDPDNMTSGSSRLIGYL
ncbi:chaperonin-containing T-complex member BBS12 isoform X2 [Parasteatoda tepidariorum]|nr:uncharacterized protein LOC107451257 isoform X2 [Parasteatoda tepidariorum]